MKHRLSTVLLALPLATALAAQDASTDAMPNPKTAAHERLAALVGTWRAETETAAMPGVPGMEKAAQMIGIERAELICNGLWLKVSGEGTCGGEEYSGVWLLGYDPHAKSYQCLVASSSDDAPCCAEARYDEATSTWHFRGETAMGKFRSEFVLDGADRSVETCWADGEDGKEVQCMRSVRTRVKGAMAEDAAAKAGAAAEGELPAPLAALHADIGTWDADFSMEMPGAPAMTMKCREVVEPICGGKWTWSTFTGEMMGMPFEGHALTGYDSKKEQVVSFWIDSANGAFMRTDGTYDASKRTFTMSGTCYDEQGNRGPVASTSTTTSEDTRELRMVFGQGEGQHAMTIAYRRAGK